MEKLHRRSDAPFFLVTGGISAAFILLILLLLAADIAFVSWQDFVNAFQKEQSKQRSS